MDIRIRRLGLRLLEVALPPVLLAGGLDGQTVIAHRGASAFLPEHTFAAWDRAVELGADYIEQDLQLTADGVLVVLHDAKLDRTVRGPADSCTGAVAERTLAQLRRCEVSSWKVEALRAAGQDSAADLVAGLPPQRIPTLDEVFDRYGTDGRVRYYIETKNPDESPGMEAELLRVLRAHDLYPESPDDRTVLIQSFSRSSLMSLASVAPELPLVQLGAAGVEERAATDVMAAIAEYAIGWGPSHALATTERVRAAHDAGLVVHPYTVNDPERMRALLGAGVDGMFTDLPGVLIEILGR